MSGADLLDIVHFRTIRSLHFFYTAVYVPYYVEFYHERFYYLFNELCKILKSEI